MPLYVSIPLILSLFLVPDPGPTFSRYVPMRDGVRLAVDIWMPAGSKSAKVPTLPMFTQGRPERDREIYRIVVRALAARALDVPGVATGRVFLGPYVFPRAVLPAEDGKPYGRRLPEGFLRDVVDGVRVAGICQPAREFRCRGVDEGVAIHLTEVRWSSPVEAHVVGVVVRVPSRQSIVLNQKTENAFWGYTLTRTETGWAVSDAVLIADPRAPR